MTADREDRDLRALFESQRAEDAREAERVPRPADVRSARAARGDRVGIRVARGRLVLAGTLAAGLALLLLRGGAPEPDPTSPAPDPGTARATWALATDWTTPTDFLLESPGADLYWTFPDLGSGEDPNSSGGGRWTPSRSERSERRHT